MITITEESSYLTEVKGSKFFSYLVPSKDFDETLSRLRIENPKATHIVYASRHYNEFDQIVEASSDDGEPKGAAGPPALSVLRGEDLINVAVLVVRYFGGTKLGIGGMIRAYTQSVKEVIENTNTIKYEKMILLSFSCRYSELQRIEYLLKKHDIDSQEKQFVGDGAEWKIEATQKQLDEFMTEAGRAIICDA